MTLSLWERGLPVQEWLLSFKSCFYLLFRADSQSSVGTPAAFVLQRVPAWSGRSPLIQDDFPHSGRDSQSSVTDWVWTPIYLERILRFGEWIHLIRKDSDYYHFQDGLTFFQMVFPFFKMGLTKLRSDSHCLGQTRIVQDARPLLKTHSSSSGRTLLCISGSTLITDVELRFTLAQLCWVCHS